MEKLIRVLVVDDSALMRKLVTDMLTQDLAIQVIGQARDGADALRKLPLLKPDVLTLDVEMPILDGYETLEAIMKDSPMPVIMLSSLTQAGAEATIRCLQLGAIDFVSKPTGSISLDVANVAKELIAKVKIAALSSFRPALSRRVQPSGAIQAEAAIQGTRPIHPSLICIGASTGGPKALHRIIPQFDRSLDVALVIVQHLPESFTAVLAARLNQDSEYEVREAVEGDQPRAGLALVAPGGRHLEFNSAGGAHLSNAPAVHGVRPAVDVTMGSLIKSYGAKMIGILLTGMGKDGALAMKGVRDSGGFTVAEDESTCVVFGMPRAARDLGGVERMAPLDQIPWVVTDFIERSRRSGLAGVASRSAN